MSAPLSTEELVRLVRTVFRPREEDAALAVLVDLPDERLPDRPDWAARRALAADWHARLHSAVRKLGPRTVDLIGYRNARSNNADLPATARVLEPGAVPDHADEVAGRDVAMEQVFERYRLMLALTELSATAPLKLNAPKFGFRAATMPRFRADMVPALRLDYAEIDARCRALKQLLDEATAARIRFGADGDDAELTIDLRHRRATASGGLVTEPGTAGNLPSRETYIVPYEGERADDPSRTRGTLPLELEGELLLCRIEANRVVELRGAGGVAARERRKLAAEPAYANVAELGFGLLAQYGIRPVGEILLDEKLGLHVAFGRSDHFGGSVGAADFSAPDRVVHVDRVYLPELQPRVRVRSVELESEGAGPKLLMRDGRYV